MQQLSTLTDKKIENIKIANDIALKDDYLILNKYEFNYATFVNITFEDTDFIDCEFISSRFVNCTFINCNFRGVSFENMYINKSEFIDCDLSLNVVDNLTITETKSNTKMFCLHKIENNINIDTEIKIK